MRTLKDPAERRNEILDAAHLLFTTKGYGKTTIIDILDAVGIAKGTFYYYFKSKEEVMDAIILRIVNREVLEAKEIAAGPDLSPAEKIMAVLVGQKPLKGNGKEEMIAQLHSAGNADMHLKSLIKTIEGLAPVLAGIVREGTAQKQFVCPYPDETVELLLTAASVLFDEALFPAHTTPVRRTAFIQMMEKSLGAPEGTFAGLAQVIAD